jgi:hypothetical protein
MRHNEGMSTLDVYLEQAPERAQSVVNWWGHMHRAGIKWTQQFDAVLDLACKYLEAKREREQSEDFETWDGLAGKMDAEIAKAKADEAAKKRAFVEAYRTANEKTS